MQLLKNIKIKAIIIVVCLMHSTTLFCMFDWAVELAQENAKKTALNKSHLSSAVLSNGDSDKHQKSYDFPTYAMQCYEAKLPKISAMTGLFEQRIADFLCAFVGNVRTGKDALVKKITHFTHQKMPIKMLLLGFSVKSSNVEKKVLGAEIDFAEYVGLFTLNYICKQIQSIYKPGAILMLYTREIHLEEASHKADDLLGIPLFTNFDRIAYQRALHELVRCHFRCLQICEIDNIEARYKAVYGKLLTIKKLEAQEKEFEGMAQFIYHELDSQRVKRLGHKKSDMQKAAQEIAKVMFVGTRVTREVLAHHVRDYDSCIRLSIREDGDGDVSNKLGIPLVHGSIGTPWHNVLVINILGEINLMSKKKACSRWNLLISVPLVRQTARLGSLELDYLVDNCKVPLLYYMLG